MGNDENAPHTCEECGYFDPNGVLPCNEGDGIVSRQGPVCNLEPPTVLVVPGPNESYLINGFEVFTRPDRMACRHGVRRGRQ